VVTLLYIGRLEDRKGVLHVVGAVRAHNARGAEQWRLVVLGDGPDRSRLEARAGQDRMIIFVGAASDDEKRAWLRRAHVLVAPSDEGREFRLDTARSHGQ